METHIKTKININVAVADNYSLHTKTTNYSLIKLMMIAKINFKERCKLGLLFYIYFLFSSWKNFLFWKYFKNTMFKILDDLKKLTPWYHHIF